MVGSYRRLGIDSREYLEDVCIRLPVIMASEASGLASASWLRSRATRWRFKSPLPMCCRPRIARGSGSDLELSSYRRHALSLSEKFPASYLALALACCLVWGEIARATTVTYHMSSHEPGADIIAAVEPSEVGSSQPGGTARLHAFSAGIYQDGNLIRLQPSVQGNTYLDVFDSIHSTSSRFTFDLPSVLGMEFSPAQVGIGTSEPGFEDLGDPGACNIRAFDGESPGSHSGLISAGAYLRSIEEAAVNPDFSFKIPEVIFEPAAALLGAFGALVLLRRRVS